jgi:hypothetical protein
MEITTELYLFLMGVTLFIIPIFVVFLVKFFYLKKEQNNLDLFLETIKTPKIILLLISFLLPIFWLTIPLTLLKLRFINFLQHSIGGGVAVTFSIIFVIESLKKDFKILNNFFIQFLIIFFVVSGFGVLNEILEFILDFLKIGIFSADRYDTWYDLLANTFGGIFAFIFYRFYILFKNFIK